MFHCNVFFFFYDVKNKLKGQNMVHLISQNTFGETSAMVRLLTVLRQYKRTSQKKYFYSH